MGMAVAVGQTRWNVSPALGKGHSDVGQVGGYASTRWDNLYLSGAIAFAWHKAETERTVTVAGTDRLESDFDATSIGGRLEGGYRLGGAQYGLTPYAAVQVQSLHTPAYSEYATQGTNQFALTFASQTTTDTRSEFGFWADTRFLFAGNTWCCAAAPPGCTTTIPAAGSILRSRPCRARASPSTAPPRRATRR